MRNQAILMLPALCSAKRCYRRRLELQLFGAENAAAPQGQAGSAEIVSGDAQPARTAVSRACDAEKQGRDAAASAAPAAEQTSAGQDKRAAFDRLIRGEYKAEFAERTQNIIDRRFRQAKALEEKQQQSERLIRSLADRYGVSAEELDALTRASAVPQGEKAAGETAHPSVPASRSQTNADPRPEPHQLAQQAARRTCARWLYESEGMKQTYPQFDLRMEMKNPDFSRMLKSGVSLRTAYQACHLDELLGGAMKYAADKAAENVTARVVDRARRPAENGSVPHAAAVFKTDVAGLTRAERERIERRAARGEQILF